MKNRDFKCSINHPWTKTWHVEPARQLIKHQATRNIDPFQDDREQRSTHDRATNEIRLGKSSPSAPGTVPNPEPYKAATAVKISHHHTEGK